MRRHVVDMLWKVGAYEESEGERKNETKETQAEELRQTFLHTNMLIHTNTPHTQLWFYTRARYRTNTFTRKRFCAQTLLHTGPFTHKHFYTQPFYTQTLLHTDAFTHKHFCTQTLLHTVPFTHSSFTRDGFYTREYDECLHTNACQRKFHGGNPELRTFTFSLAQRSLCPVGMCLKRSWSHIIASPKIIVSSWHAP